MQLDICALSLQGRALRIDHAKVAREALLIPFAGESGRGAGGSHRAVRGFSRAPFPARFRRTTLRVRQGQQSGQIEMTVLMTC